MAVASAELYADYSYLAPDR